MKVKVGGDAVPFVITYRKILEKPQIIRRRRFVGTYQTLKNIVLRVLAFADDVAYETDTEVVSPGRSVSVHWAVQVEDPWDVSGREASLVAFRMLDDMPPCGAHFEIISPTMDQKQSEDEQQRQQPLEAVSGYEEAETVRKGPRTSFRRPPDPAYAPRPVQPIANTPSGVRKSGAPLNGDGEHDEFASHLDGPGSLGEDD